MFLKLPEKNRKLIARGAFAPWKVNELVPPRGLAQVTDDCKRVVPITGAADKLC